MFTRFRGDDGSFVTSALPVINFLRVLGVGTSLPSLILTRLSSTHPTLRPVVPESTGVPSRDLDPIAKDQQGSIPLPRSGSTGLQLVVTYTRRVVSSHWDPFVERRRLCRPLKQDGRISPFDPWCFVILPIHFTSYKWVVCLTSFKRVPLCYVITLIRFVLGCMYNYFYTSLIRLVLVCLYDYFYTSV